MPRFKLYSSNAERQKAFRQRRDEKIKMLEETNERLRREVEKLEEEILQCPATKYHII